MKKQKESKKINKVGLILGILCFLLLGFILITYKNDSFFLSKEEKETIKNNCKVAICNEDKTICNSIKVDQDGNITKNWSGDCSKIK